MLSSHRHQHNYRSPFCKFYNSFGILRFEKWQAERSIAPVTKKSRKELDEQRLSIQLYASKRDNTHEICAYSANMTYLRSIGEVIGFLLLSIFAILDGIIRSFIPKSYKMKSIDGEIALVTGGGGGLGRLLSLRLANLGAVVIVWDINGAGKSEIGKFFKINKS